MSLESDLHQALGALHVITDPELTASYGTDWTGRWSTPFRVVARPADTAGVVAFVRASWRALAFGAVRGNRTAAMSPSKTSTSPSFGGGTS